MRKIVRAGGGAVKQGGGVSRRDFVKLAVTAGMVAPLFVPARLLRGQTAPSNRIRVGQIGAGRIATSHDIPGVLKAGLADYVAVCDLDSRRAPAGKAFIQKNRTGAGPAPDMAVLADYKELLARKDIDAVVISLPDHQHAEVALAACRAKKDIYLQKPFTMTHEEGVILRDAIGKSGIIFQVGSQQRSWTGNAQYQDQFRKACMLVRNGRVGVLKAVEIGLPTDPTQPDPPEMPVPANLDYERWLGPTAKVYYTEDRVHSQKMTGGSPDVSSRPGWLRNESYCLGMITGWGAHHFDTAHWGMDMELTGPSKVEGKGEFPTNKVWNVHGAYHIELTYPKGIKMTVSDKLQNGIKFIGDEGWIFVGRESGVTPSDPMVPAGLKPLDASAAKLLDMNGLKIELPYSAEHHLNWLQAVASRKPTNVAPAPVAHRATAACIVAWIAMKLGRPLTWDPVKEQFVNDAEANGMLSRPERAGYGAVRLSKT